ncbi:MAG TPA: hypothetical protein VMT62_15945, partial [Syntrophorhabdaceae bacterium]|nr:hypothetical protein [Syntrophorhabdaceae bacterium]
MEKVRNSLVLLIAVSFLMLGLSGITMAQQGKVIEITYGTPFGPDNPFSIVDQKWMAKVEKETNGQLKFKPYWGGAIIGGRDAAEELRQGAVDMAFINPTTTKSGLLITKASMIFFYGINDLNVGDKVFKEMLA